MVKATLVQPLESVEYHVFDVCRPTFYDPLYGLDTGIKNPAAGRGLIRTGVFQLLILESFTFQYRTILVQNLDGPRAGPVRYQGLAGPYTPAIAIHFE